MSDTSRSPEAVPVEEGKPSLWERVSIIWLVPILALVVALGAAWNNYNNQGPLVQITFDNAAGVKAGETVLRYRDIRVGLVEEVGFTNDLEKVEVAVRLEKELADYIDSEARFWVVRPEVSAQGVTGLDTVLSGVYIQGVWDSTPGGFTDSFVGLSTAPLLGADQEGIEFTIRSPDSLPAANTPIVYKGVQVGQVASAEIDDGGTGVSARAVIYEPYTELVSSSTRFWDVSGFSFSLGASGARLNFDSFASLITGGITFETMGSGGTEMVQDAVFQLFPNEDAARDDFLVEGDGESVTLTMIFEQNLSGLSAGAPVELGGLRVGEVASLTGFVDPDRFGDDGVRLLTTVRINPGRIGLGDGADEEDLLDYLERRIADGMRAQLTNASLLTGGLKVVLTEVPGAPEAALDRDGDPYPIVPTTEADITDVATSAQGVLQRVNDLPIEEVMQSAIGFLDNATALIGSQALQDAPEELRGILASVRGLTEGDEVQGIPGQVSDMLSDLQEISGSLNTILAELERQGLTDTLTGALERVGEAADGLPGLVARVDTILEEAENVPLGDLSDEISALITSAEAIIASPEAQQIPGEVTVALNELQSILASVNAVAGSEDTQGLPNQVANVLSDLEEISGSLNTMVSEIERQDVVTQITDAVASVEEAANGLPGIVDQADAILRDAGEVPLETLANRTSDLLASAEALINQPSTRELPEELNGALEQLTLTLEELRAGGIVDNANATLASARDAASAIEEATQLLPGIATQLRVVANQAASTLSAYGRDAEFTRETQGAIRQIEAAAQAIERLARTIERNPNSLILGR
ncbi:Paraquat-inducible protein B (plasmid) [Roseivivax sp. THAF40]|uniref:MlaD family protein n=1 Tax=Roseivivax sp. THAF40 TaxID=2587858 RepID=UPI001267A076|nr:MlaD family protein [Roseivivax sp. THAF40]QFT48673.1 Paraquat-inducible protein B [Roseivivax sp. THAF40]